MISRRLLLTGIAALTISTPSQAAFFGFKTKAEKEAEAKAEAAEIKALKKQLKLAKKKGKKLSADDLARLKELNAREAKRVALAEKKPVKTAKKEPDAEVTRVSRRELARIRAEDDKLAKAEVELKLSKRKPVLEARLEPAPKKIVRKIGKKTYTIDPKFEPQQVAFSGFPSGSIVINSQDKFLYLVETPFSARRYGVAVGKEGLDFHGTVTVGSKQEWPRWIPTKEMIERSPEKYAQYADGMDGGPNNPLGARAIYLYEGQKDTYLRIHGTTQPWTIGTAASNGCFRMVNEHVIDLFSRVSVGTKVTVL